MMRKLAVLAFLLLVLCVSVSAISSSDAIDFVQSEKHFLSEGETPEVYPNTAIALNNQKYWVVSVLVGDNVNGFIAVKETAKEIEVSRVNNRELFQTAFVLRSLMKYKDDLTKRGKSWFFSSSNAQIFGTFSRRLSDESNELISIQQELNLPEADTQISLMNSKIVSMTALVESLQNEMNDAVKKESDFLYSPKTSQPADLKKAYSAVNDSLTELDSMALDYDSMVKSLKQLIAQTDWDIQSKQGFNNLADPPEELYQVPTWALNVKDLVTGIDSFYSTSNSNINSWLDGFDSRNQLNASYQLLYGNDDKLMQQTGNVYKTIAVGANNILLSANKPYWKEQGSVTQLESDWAQAEKYFKQKNFSPIPALANKIRSNILKIYSEGFVEQEQPSILKVLTDNIFSIILVLIIILAAVIVFANRKKFFGAPKGEEEIEFEGLKGFK